MLPKAVIRPLRTCCCCRRAVHLLSDAGSGLRLTCLLRGFGVFRLISGAKVYLYIRRFTSHHNCHPHYSWRHFGSSCVVVAGLCGFIAGHHLPPRLLPFPFCRTLWRNRMSDPPNSVHWPVRIVVVRGKWSVWALQHNYCFNEYKLSRNLIQMNPCKRYSHDNNADLWLNYIPTSPASTTTASLTRTPCVNVSFGGGIIIIEHSSMDCKNTFEGVIIIKMCVSPRPMCCSSGWIDKYVNCSRGKLHISVEIN